MTDPTTCAPCCCHDTEVETLRALVAAGHDQREVSHLLWGDQGRASVAVVDAFCELAREEEVA